MSISVVVEAVHEIAISRSRNAEDHKSKTAALDKWISPLTAEQLVDLRRAYVNRYYVDPEHHLRSFDVFQEDPRLRLERGLLLELLGILNRPEIAKDLAYVAQLLEKAEAGSLSPADRSQYYSWLPRIGLWDAPARASPDGAAVDAYERLLRVNAWAEKNPAASPLSFDATLQKIESALPPSEFLADTPREKTIAVIASSHGAQWQELVDWALGMMADGCAVRVFSPFGRPLAIQRDSMLVREPPTEAVAVSLGLPGIGLGAPLRLDPLRLPADKLESILGSTACASEFDPSRFGAVYLAGGLGFNEDVAVTQPQGGDRSKASIEATPNIKLMMDRAVEHRLPIIALCHGPTLLACLDIEVGGQKEKLVKGVPVAALPALEPMVHAQGKLEPQFSFFTWKTHEVLAASGAVVDEAGDLADMTTVRTGEKDGLRMATGPGPQTALNLIGATKKALAARWA